MRSLLALVELFVLTCLLGCQPASDSKAAPDDASATQTAETSRVVADRRLEFEDLAAAVREAHERRDVNGFARLIIGLPGQPADVQNHLDLFQADLDRMLEDIEFLPLDDTESLEYTLNGVVYRPASAPEGWMRMDLRTLSGNDSESTDVEVTRMLVGMVHGEWWIISAAPAITSQSKPSDKSTAQN